MGQSNLTMGKLTLQKQISKDLSEPEAFLPLKHFAWDPSVAHANKPFPPTVLLDQYQIILAYWFFVICFVL